MGKSSPAKSSSEGSDEELRVDSGDRQEPANSTLERVDISSDSDPNEDEKGNGNSQEQAEPVAPAETVAVSQALPSPEKFTVSGSQDGALSEQAEESSSSKLPRTSVSSRKRDKITLFSPPGGDLQYTLAQEAAQHALAQEAPANSSSQHPDLEGQESEARGKKPKERVKAAKRSKDKELKKLTIRGSKRSREPVKEEASVMSALVERLDQQAKQIADLMHELQNERKETEKLREDCQEMIDENHRLGLTVREQQDRLSESKPAPNPLENPEYRQRFEWLVQRGWTMTEAGEALEATKQGTVYSSTRADAHLKALTDQERSSAVAAGNAQMATTKDDSLSIAENSSIAAVLAKNMDAVDIVVKLKTTHAQTKARTAHTAQTAVGAANLVQITSVANDASLSRKGPLFLSQAALAVCEDCTK